MLLDKEEKEEECIELLQQILKIRRDKLGMEHLDVAEVLDALGSIYLEGGKHEKALSEG